MTFEGKRVLLVDADPQGVTISLGWADQDNLPVTLSTQMGKIICDEPIETGEGILRHDEGVDLIPANSECHRGQQWRCLCKEKL